MGAGRVGPLLDRSYRPWRSSKDDSLAIWEHGLPERRLIETSSEAKPSLSTRQHPRFLGRGRASCQRRATMSKGRRGGAWSLRQRPPLGLRAEPDHDETEQVDEAD